MAGFITIERDLWKHPVFARSEMTEREAWMWMIANAAWAGTQHRVGADVVEVPRGSFMVTLREMQSAFMWKSDKRVRNFLQKLENHGMLTVQTLGKRNARKTHVTICKYDEYQTSGRSKDAAKTHHGRTADAVKEQGNKGTRKDTNVSLDAKVSKILSSAASASVAADFVAHRREIKKPMTERAAKAMAEKLHGHHDPDAVLKDSISNGWQGVFPDRIRPKFQSIDGGKTQNAKRPIADHFEDSQPEMDCWPDRNASQPLLPASDERTDSGGCDARLDQGPVWLFSGTDQRCL